ncbi:MAG: hypothetical protein FJW68_03010 [Actinobacteria bacterium]|nr:hypothetical protein [Actinomycetota bacterium]
MKVLEFIDKKNIDTWLDNVSGKYEVFLPVRDMENAVIEFLNYKDFKRTGSQQEASGKKRFEAEYKEKTTMSPKHLFFPATEKLFDFEYIKDIKNPQKTGLELTTAEKEDCYPGKVLFGLKPCDADGIARLDKVFNEGYKEDNYYHNKRKGSILVSIGCKEIFPDCFCTLVGGNPFNFENADIGMIEVSHGYAIVKISENAEDLINFSRQYLSKDFKAAAIEEEIENLVNSSSKKIIQYWDKTSPDDMAAVMDKSINTGVWDVITSKCISCGACTYVCPTCFCFNLRDEQKNLKGQRYRCWDYCMNNSYTLEASGHNPRADKSQRYKNKVNCKYNYNIKRNKKIYCVGCGRCIEICPVSMDIREAVKMVITDNKE